MAPNVGAKSTSKSASKSRQHVAESPAAEPVAGARPQKMATQLADRIQRDIAKLGWEVGLLIGNEVQLMEQYQVSRATLREAVRQLERHGVATMRRGFGGGLTVQEPANRAAVRALSTFLELTHVSIRELFEVKTVLELRATALASRRMSDEHVHALREAMRLINETPFDQIEEEARLHASIRRTIATAAGNPALAVFMEGLNRITNKLLPDYAHISRMTKEHKRERELRQLQVEALIAGDESKVEQATLEELAIAQQATERGLKHFRREASAFGTLSDAQPPRVIPWDAQDKLPHRLAAAIAYEISSARLEPGSRVGSEPEFLERFGVSRAVFREAIRLLEGYGIVQMRRGYGGGLVVGEPDPTHTVSLVTAYLEHAGMARNHFLEIIGVLWLAAAPWAAQRANKEKAHVLLLKAQAVDVSKPVVAMTETRNHFLELLDLTDNRALRLVGAVVYSLGKVHTLESLPSDELAEFKRLHCALFSAVEEGDAGMARRTMSRWLTAMGEKYGGPKTEDNSLRFPSI